MKVTNMTSANGNQVVNQFIIEGQRFEINGLIFQNCEVFQSYDSVIAFKSPAAFGGTHVVLDRNTWNYSKTTSKYRNQFLGETTKETQAKIDSGEYTLADLN